MASDFRRQLLALLDGHRTPEVAIADPTPAVQDPAPLTRHADPAPPGKRPARRRATIPAKDLSPETKDPSPE